MNIAIFENELHDPLNVGFRLKLQHQIKGVSISHAGNIVRFEQLLLSKKYDVFILDIMSTDEIFSIEDGEKVPESRVGIELLTRIKKKYYSNQNPESLVIMRTARATELSILNLCISKGAERVFSPGSDDKDLIEVIKNFSKQKQ